MKLSWVFFIAGRSFKTRRREKGHASSVLATAGIAVGTATLIAVLGVMNGFQLGFIDDILEISSYHLRIDGSEERPFTEADAEAVRAVPGVVAVMPFTEVQTIVRSRFGGQHGILLRGVPVNAGALDPRFLEYLNVIDGAFDLSVPGSIVLGRELAYSLGVEVGDTVSLLALGGTSGGGVAGALRAEDVTLTVRGVFRSGYYLFDLTWGVLSLEDAERFLPSGGRTVWGVKIANRYADSRLAAAVRNGLGQPDAAGTGLSIVSWREYNSSFFGALRMEKLLMMLLVGLIFVVVGVNIYHALRRSIYEKTEEIGVLKALGAPPILIQAVFVFEGVLIGTVGGVIGLLLGLLISSRINEVFGLLETVVNLSLQAVEFLVMPLLRNGGFQRFSLFSPLYFYITEVPSRVIFSEALLIFLFAVFSAVGAAYYASRRVAAVAPAEVLRYE
jgi:lipoprotein-releasing system permease protein